MRPQAPSLPRALAFFLALLALAGAAGAAGAPGANGASAEAAFIIVNPAGRGNQSQAQSFLADFARALRASWPEEAPPCPDWRGHYHVHQADALASIRGAEPIFGLLSPGFFLATSERLEAEPRLVPVLSGGGESSIVRLVALEGGPAAAQLERASVEGLRLGGQLVGEPVWTRRVLLAGLAGAEEAPLVPQERTLAAVRALRKGAVDALLLSDADWSRLVSVGMAGGLASPRSVGDLLPGPVVLLGLPPELRAAQAEEERAARRALGEAAIAALRRFPQTEAGRAVLDTMGLEGFAPATARDYHRLERLYSGAADEPMSR